MNARHCVMVCVTKQVSCEHLIREGAQLAQKHKLPLIVVHVSHPDEDLLGNPSQGEALEYLFGIAKEYNAQMNVIKSADVFSTLSEYAREHKAMYVVAGQHGKTAGEEGGFSWKLNNCLPASAKLYPVPS